jgi:hypothetical protein
MKYQISLRNFPFSCDIGTTKLMELTCCIRFYHCEICSSHMHTTFERTFSKNFLQVKQCWQNGISQAVCLNVYIGKWYVIV